MSHYFFYRVAQKSLYRKKWFELSTIQTCSRLISTKGFSLSTTIDLNKKFYFFTYRNGDIQCKMIFAPLCISTSFKSAGSLIIAFFLLIIDTLMFESITIINARFWKT